MIVTESITVAIDLVAMCKSAKQFLEIITFQYSVSYLQTSFNSSWWFYLLTAESIATCICMNANVHGTGSMKRLLLA